MRFIEKVASLASEQDPVTERHIVLSRRNTDETAYQDLLDRGVDAHELAHIAHVVATEASALVEKRRSELAGQHHNVGAAATKSSEVDPVTVVDQESESFIRQRLAELSPGSSVLGEEEGELGSQAPAADSQTTDSRAADILWVVDPIDGTVNFMYGVPAYAVSVAASVDGVPVAGAVADVVHNCVAVGAVGMKPYVENAGGERHDLSYDAKPTTIQTTLVATGFSYDAERRAAQGKVLASLLPQVRDIRRIGSAALDLVRVASGEVDAYYEHGLGPWDHAAGSLIAARAGAQVMMPKLDVQSADGLMISAAREDIAESFVDAVIESAAGGVLHPLKK